MYKRILLALDGSSLAEQALPHAIAQAELFAAEMVLLKVLEPILYHSTLETGHRRAEEVTSGLAREYLDRIAVSIRERGIPVEVATAVGRPHEAIVRFAEENQVDLIVICTRGQSGLSRWLMGSVADRVVRGASVPVLLVSTRKPQASKS